MRCLLFPGCSYCLKFSPFLGFVSPAGAEEAADEDSLPATPESYERGSDPRALSPSDRALSFRSDASQPADSHTRTPADSHTRTPADSNTRTPVDLDTRTPADSHTRMPTDSDTRAPVDPHDHIDREFHRPADPNSHCPDSPPAVPDSLTSSPQTSPRPDRDSHANDRDSHANEGNSHVHDGGGIPPEFCRVSRSSVEFRGVSRGPSTRDPGLHPPSSPAPPLNFIPNFATTTRDHEQSPHFARCALI
jgi:hypothetical protein